MFTVILTIHLTLCVFLVLLVLLQQGKGADVGASFGGGSQTLFGASGAGNILSRATTILAICFMFTSIFLVNAYSTYVPTVTTPSASGNLSGSVMGEVAKDESSESATEAVAPVAKDDVAAAPVPASSKKEEAPVEAAK